MHHWVLSFSFFWGSKSIPVNETSSLECSRMCSIVLSNTFPIPASIIVLNLAEEETRLILLVNKDGSMATGVLQLAEACQALLTLLFRICFVQQVNKNAETVNILQLPTKGYRYVLHLPCSSIMIHQGTGFPCDSSVKHSCFGFNTFNVGLLEISTATVYRQVYQVGIGKTAFKSGKKTPARFYCSLIARFYLNPSNYTCISSSC